MKNVDMPINEHKWLRCKDPAALLDRASEGELYTIFSSIIGYEYASSLMEVARQISLERPQREHVVLNDIRKALLHLTYSMKKSKKRFCEYARCISGNPFRKSPPPVYYLAEDVITNARRIAAQAVKEKDFSHLPVLADFLSENGCEDDELLGHLRGKLRCHRCLGSGKFQGESCQNCHGCGWLNLKYGHTVDCWALRLIQRAD